MSKSLRIVTAVLVFGAMTLGVSSLLTAQAGRPAPPPPVLCGCMCPDGSFVITHAPKAKDCPNACEAACNAGSSEY